MKKIILLMSLLLTVGLASSGWAAWTSCVPSISGDLVTNDGCQSNPLFTNDTIGVVNSDGGMFSFNDWVFAGKDEFTSFDPGIVDIGFDITGGQSSGNWSINASAWSIYEDIALVFKDGQGTYLVTYSLVTNSTGGTWTTPFTDPPFDLPGNSTSHEVSHISAYARGTSVVPEPGTMVLLGSGLIGLAGWGRKKFRE
jgi:hypothetical protein